MDKNFFVYILLTENNKLYCGYTNNVEKRYHLHKIGKGAKFTRANKPKSILFVKKCSTKSEALKLEYFIKQLDRSKKLKYIYNHQFENTLS